MSADILFSLAFTALLVLVVMHPIAADNSYGDVSFDTSCSTEVQEDFNTALSMMYSFWYSESLALFDDVLLRDPQCCMVREVYMW